MSALYGINTTQKPAAESTTSSDLVQDFLFYSGDLDAQAAAAIAGVSTATLGRWRMMGARQLRSDVRERLVRYLAEREEKAGIRAA